MSENENKKRCIQCNKIIVGKSKFGLCPKCADKDARGAASSVAVSTLAVIVIKKAWKPAIELVKTAVKIVTKA